jgi:integrin-linked kinase-associated serine/threonine phosphatase 2C
VGPYRVWQDDEGPGIAMTRSLGDLAAKKIGLISEPEI